MPRPGPARKIVSVRLSEAELEPVRAYAETETGGDVSTAIRTLVVRALNSGLAEADRRTITISDAGVAALDQLAERDGCSLDEITRRVLKYGAFKMPPGYTG